MYSLSKPEHLLCVRIESYSLKKYRGSMKKTHVYLVGFGFIVVIMIIAGVLLATSNRYETEVGTSDISNISVSVIGTPKITMNKDSMEISYILELSGFKKDELTLTKVEVLNKKSGGTIKTFEQESLRKIYAQGENEKVPKLQMTLSFLKEDTPPIIIHRLRFVSAGKAILPFSVTGGEIRI